MFIFFLCFIMLTTYRIVGEVFAQLAGFESGPLARALEIFRRALQQAATGVSAENGPHSMAMNKGSV